LILFQIGIIINPVSKTNTRPLREARPATLMKTLDYGPIETVQGAALCAAKVAYLNAGLIIRWSLIRIH
jgi:hypothetical protein